MRFFEIQKIKPNKPLNASQARLFALKKQRDNINVQIKAEKIRQLISK